MRASLARSALADSAVEVTIFVDRFSASGDVFGGSELDLGVCLHEVSHGERFLLAIEFDAISSPKAAPVRQCEGRNIAW